MSAKESFYRSVSNDYRNLGILRRVDSIVLIEDKEDESFWSQVFGNFTSSKKVFFISQTRHPSGQEVSGVDNIHFYFPYLGKGLIACIDSDFRNFRKEPNLNIHHHIFQTHTHSIENHKCFAPSLNGLYQKATNSTNTDFDFVAFLHSYSEIIFELFCYSLYFICTNDKQYKLSEFATDVAINNTIDIRDNATYELKLLNEHVQSSLGKLKGKVSSTDFESFKSTLDINPSSTYLFMRGHTLYDGVVSRILNVLCNHAISKQYLEIQANSTQEELTQRRETYKAGLIPYTELLKTNFTPNGYEQIELLKSDIETYFSNE